MQRVGLVCSVAAFLLVCTLFALPARGEAPPHRPSCPTDYWRSHRQPPCGWGSVPSLIHRIFHSTHGPRAYCVAKRESGLRPRAVNRSSGASGLMQLIPMHWRGRFNPLNPVLNLLYAYRLSHGGTYWAPWAPLGGC